MKAGDTTKVALWATGRRYKAGQGSHQDGPVYEAPPKPKELLDAQGRLFVRSRPQYEDLELPRRRQPALRHFNMGDRDQTLAFVMDAKNAGKVAYFLAGIYLVQGTVTLPTGSRVQGSSWSQVRQQQYIAYETRP